MSTIGTIAEIIETGLSMIDKYVDDPKRRLKARQEYVDKCKRKAGEILNAEGLEELDKLLLDFIANIHSL